MIQVVLNGEKIDLRAGDLAQALIEAGYGEALVATALNGDFVPAGQRASTKISEGDAIEVIAPLQGG